MNMKIVGGGICAAKGFKAAGVHCGIRAGKDKKDLALIVSEKRAAAACVYTKNLVRGAPIEVTKANVSDGYASAVIVNSGNANTCNSNGIEIARAMCGLVEEHTGIHSDDVVVASTGVIGRPLDISPIRGGMAALVSSLGGNSTDAARAIMTTDLSEKEIAYEFTLGGRICRIGGIAKGSGMIHPNMATMLAFITTDVSISPKMLQEALSADVESSFNMISVDGDTSTNDMVTVLANGMALNEEINAPGTDFDIFCEILGLVTSYLCKAIAGDGEGATKLLECKVTGAADLLSARAVAKSVVRSPLVKSAMFGSDANWGRVLCAVGYAGAVVDVNRVDVRFSSRNGTVEVCRGGRGVDFSEEDAKSVLLAGEIVIEICLGDGQFAAKAWGCDLTYDYVRINGDYRT